MVDRSPDPTPSESNTEVKRDIVIINAFEYQYCSQGLSAHIKNDKKPVLEDFTINIFDPFVFRKVTLFKRVEDCIL
jgi:3-dehydroquinate dehydratase